MAAVTALNKAGAGQRVDGVKLGYDVIEQHMRQAAAAGPRSRSAKAGKIANHQRNEIQDTVARLFRALSELMPLMGELVNSRTAAGLAQNLLFNNPLVQAPNQVPHGDAAARVTIEVSSVRPASVTIELHPEAERRALATAGLHDPRAGKPALSGIVFSPAKGRKKAYLRIRVPDSQPAGVYSGVLRDRSTGEPRGVLTVRLAR